MLKLDDLTATLTVTYTFDAGTYLDQCTELDEQPTEAGFRTYVADMLDDPLDYLPPTLDDYDLTLRSASTTEKVTADTILAHIAGIDSHNPDDLNYWDEAPEREDLTTLLDMMRAYLAGNGAQETPPMSARGTVLIHSTDDAALLALPYITTHLHPDAEPGQVLLDHINTLDTGALLDGAPNIVWVAYMDPDTEEPGIMFAHLPGRGLYAHEHLNNTPVVPLTLLRDLSWDELVDISPATVAVLDALHDIDAAKGN